MKTKHYTVWKGRKPGVYNTWQECKEQTDGYEGARYKAFPTREAAEKALSEDYHDYIDLTGAGKTKTAEGDWERNAIAVDASCTGNPGETEFRGVDLTTGETVFTSKTYKKGTNNIGEVLAVVKALEILRRNGDSERIVYTDSQTAIAVARSGKMKCTLQRDSSSAEILDALEAALKMLEKNEYKTEIRKWDTERWGEIPADFGRK